jgi:hypothetical protein
MTTTRAADDYGEIAKRLKQLRAERAIEELSGVPDEETLEFFGRQYGVARISGESAHCYRFRLRQAIEASPEGKAS